MWQLHGTSFHGLIFYASNLPSNAMENSIASIYIRTYNWKAVCYFSCRKK